MSGYEALPWVQYSEFLDHLKTALLVVDNDTVVYANAAAAHITGHQSPAELVGIRLATVLAPDLGLQTCCRLSAPAKWAVRKGDY